MPLNRWLVAGGIFSMAAALLHLACIVGGGEWYRFFGAGEDMARAAERGESYPAIITFGIAAILSIWSAYGFAGAGLVPKLPLMRTALVAISAVYLLRAAMLIPLLVLRPDLIDSFAAWSSLIVLAIGISYAIGTWRAWSPLSVKDAVYALDA